MCCLPSDISLLASATGGLRATRGNRTPVYYLTPSTTCSCHSFLFCLFLASVRFCVVELLVPVLPLISILSAEKHDRNTTGQRIRSRAAAYIGSGNETAMEVTLATH